MKVRCRLTGDTPWKYGIIRINERGYTVEHSNVGLAFGLTLFAGLATGIGSIIGFSSREFNSKFLSGALGFSAGVMIYVSFAEILVKAKDLLTLVYGVKKGSWVTAAAFFAGIAVIAAIDKLVPSFHNPHEMHTAAKFAAMDEKKKQKLMRMGLFSALAVAVHNFPEGLATFMSVLSDPALGVSIAVAIAIHNIPEGLAVSVPIHFATKDRKKAFILSFLSGLSEPVGALIGYSLLRPVFNRTILGLVFAGVAGLMVYIALDELLPAAEEYGEHHVAITGVIAGMAAMAVSLLLFI
jgi:ZIP family zinc transporter